MLPPQRLAAGNGIQTSLIKISKCGGLIQGDLLLLAAGEPAVVHKALDRVRQYVAADLGETDESKHALLWVTGAPLPSIPPVLHLALTCHPKRTYETTNAGTFF